MRDGEGKSRELLYRRGRTLSGTGTSPIDRPPPTQPPYCQRRGGYTAVNDRFAFKMSIRNISFAIFAIIGIRSICD